MTRYIIEFTFLCTLISFLHAVGPMVLHSTLWYLRLQGGLETATILQSCYLILQKKKKREARNCPRGTQQASQQCLQCKHGGLKGNFKITVSAAVFYLLGFSHAKSDSFKRLQVFTEQGDQSLHPGVPQSNMIKAVKLEFSSLRENKFSWVF